MSSTNQTTNYELPLFIGTDKPTWLGDFNGAMNKIDTAIKAVSDVASGNTSSIGSVESDVDSLESQVGTLENTVASHTSDIASQGQSITALTTTTNQLNTRVTANASAIDDLNSDVTELQYHNPGATVDITNETSYTTPIDGYIKIANNGSSNGYIDISVGGVQLFSLNACTDISNYGITSFYVKKGVVVSHTSTLTDYKLRFEPFSN